MEKENIENLIQQYEKYAEENGFRLNPNEKIVEGLTKALLENEKKHGARYCPCRRITGDVEEDKAKICPCVWNKKEIEETGHCHCNLFVKR